MEEIEIREEEISLLEFMELSNHIQQLDFTENIELKGKHKANYLNMDKDTIAFIELFLFCRGLLKIPANNKTLTIKLKKYDEQFKDLDEIDRLFVKFHECTQWLKPRIRRDIQELIKNKEQRMKELIYTIMGMLEWGD